MCIRDRYNNRYSKDVLYKVYRNGFLIGMGFYDGVTTVSYTHLDVYKRQELDKGETNIEDEA